MKYEEYIEINPKILFGKPVIKGTRVPVELILDMLASGLGKAQILEEYPSLKAEQIRACAAYAAKLVKAGKPLPKERRGSKHARLAAECAKLVRAEEQALARRPGFPLSRE